MVVKLERRSHLLDVAGLQHDDLVGHGHGLHLIVGHIDHRGIQLLMQTGEFDAHLYPQRGVEVRQRLIEQEHLRVAHDSAADGYPLPLAARERLGGALEERLEVQDLRSLPYLLVALLLRHLGEPQGEAHVVGHGHMRVQRIALEHHRAAALVRGHFVGQLAVDAQLAAADFFQPGDHAQQRRLAASRRTDEDGELAVFHAQIDVPDDKGFTVGLAQALAFNGCHGWTLPLQMVWSGAGHLTAPKVRPRTSCFCVSQPKIRIGTTASVEAADSLAQNRPSGLENDAMKAVSGAALAADRFRLQNASFQHRMIDNKPVDAIPGADERRATRHNGRT